MLMATAQHSATRSTAVASSRRLEAGSVDVMETTGWPRASARGDGLGALFRNVAGVSVILISIYVAFGMFGRGVEMFPSVEPEFASVDIRARGDLSTDEKDLLVRQVEAFILGSDEMESIYKDLSDYVQTYSSKKVKLSSTTNVAKLSKAFKGLVGTKVYGKWKRNRSEL